MTRWRPPVPKKSAYITADGFARLQEELKGLWSRRAGVTQALSAAAAEGDRSENAEYIYRKKELREIDRRIRYLQKRIPDLQVVSQPATDVRRIFFGAWVRLENSEGVEFIYRIVGPDEFDAGKGWISLDSPLARSMMKKSVDDEVSVETPNGVARYYVVEVSYEALADAGQSGGQVN